MTTTALLARLSRDETPQPLLRAPETPAWQQRVRTMVRSLASVGTTGAGDRAATAWLA